MQRCCAPTMAQCGSGGSRERIAVGGAEPGVGSPAEDTITPDRVDSEQEELCRRSSLGGRSMRRIFPKTRERRSVCFICMDMISDARGLDAAATALTHVEFYCYPHHFHPSRWFLSPTADGFSSREASGRIKETLPLNAG